MLVIPAVDILEGKVVRLYKGRENNVFFYSDSPLEIIEFFSKAGAKLVHIVDLSGAIRNSPQIELLKEIAPKIKIDFWWAGGLRSRERIIEVLNLGAKKVIVSSLVKDVESFKRAVEGLTDRILVSLDLKGTQVRIKGWNESLNMSFEEILDTLKNMGFKEFVITDTERDGTLLGVDIEKFKKLLKDKEAEFYIAGGLGSEEDIERLKEIKNIKGVIIGRAIYEGKINLKEVFEKCSQEE